MQPVPQWLVVEDEEDDFFLVSRCCKKLSPPVKIVRACHGKEAQEFLSSAASLPDLILSDISMPHVNGLELLEWVRTSPALAAKPFVILTNSNSEADKDRARRLGAAAYFTKPLSVEALGAILQSVANRWSGKGHGQAVPES